MVAHNLLWLQFQIIWHPLLASSGACGAQQTHRQNTQYTQNKNKKKFNSLGYIARAYLKTKEPLKSPAVCLFTGQDTRELRKWECSSLLSSQTLLVISGISVGWGVLLLFKLKDCHLWTSDFAKGLSRLHRVALSKILMTFLRIMFFLY